MTARFYSYSDSVSCCGNSAAACTSAHMIPIMDTAISLVVSICVILSIILSIPMILIESFIT